MFRVIVWLVAAAPVWAQVFSVSAIDRAVEEARAAWKAPGIALAIVHGDRAVLVKGYGVKRFGSAEPVTPDTVFVIASMTKAFATASMAMLIDEGRMSWDDPVRKHLPYFHLSEPLADASVTLRDIVSHRTGLSRHDLLWLGSPWNRGDLIRRMAELKLSKPFRAEYQYQNLMFTTAGEAVAAVAGKPWEEFVRQRIFEPLSMRNSSFKVEEGQKNPDHATGHERNAKHEMKAVDWRNVDNIGAAGEINSTARDLVNWIRLHLNEGLLEGKRLISEANVREMHSPQIVVRMDAESRATNPDSNFLNYGLGWRVYDYKGEYVVSHGGSLRGFRSHVTLLPKHDVGFVVLSNLGSNALPEALRNTIIDIVLEKPGRDWNQLYLAAAEKSRRAEEEKKRQREAKRRKGTRPALPLLAYTGAYTAPGYGQVEVFARNSVLYLKWSSFESKLRHFHFDTFDIKDSSPLEDRTVQFILGPDATVDRLEMMDIEFRRVKATCAESTCSETQSGAPPR